MQTRRVYLEKDRAFTASTVIVTDINISDPISLIEVLVEMTNGSAMTEASVVKPHDDITKIELVDGSDVLWSSNMERIQAYNAFKNKCLPYMELTLDDNAVQRENCFLQFGLKRYDKEHYLPPEQFRNLQLRITITMTTAAVTAWAASGHTVSVIAHVMEEGTLENKGFITFQDTINYTAVDGAVETIDMPTDDPYQAIIIQALKTGADITGSLEKIKLSVDADRYVPLELDFDHLVKENAAEFGAFEQRLVKRLTGAGDVYGDLYGVNLATVAVDTASNFAEVVAVAGEKVFVEINNIATS